MIGVFLTPGASRIMSISTVQHFKAEISIKGWLHNLLSFRQIRSSRNAGYIIWNYVLHKTAVANKLQFLETRSSAYNTTTVTYVNTSFSVFSDETQINLAFLW